MLVAKQTEVLVEHHFDEVDLIVLWTDVVNIAKVILEISKVMSQLIKKLIRTRNRIIELLKLLPSLNIRINLFFVLILNKIYDSVVTRLDFGTVLILFDI